VFRSVVLILIALLTLGVMHGLAVPIALHDGLVWADVDCNGTTLHFVVDTGAGCTCVNLKAARRLGMRLCDAVNVAGVGGHAIGYRCAGFTGTVGGMQLPAQVLALDLSGPARACSQPIDGLIGADFFQGNVVRIDYGRSTLTRMNASTGSAGVRLRFANGVICVPVAVNGCRARWTRLDTGCTNALIWSDAVVERAIHAARSVALASSAHSTIPATVTVGGMPPHVMPVKWCNREIFPGEAGLLGNAALSKYRAITVDGVGKRLVLLP
jgi:hypothetical protein